MQGPAGGGRPGGNGAGGGGGRRGPGGQVGVLHVLAGNDRGKQYPLVNPQTQIGRGADQDFILADIAVSRRHVIILIEGERYRLKDLGSGNGTLLNGTRSATAILNDGDQIEIGNTLLRFDHPPSRAAAVAPQPVPQATPQQRTVIADAPMQFQQPPPAQQQWQPPPQQQQQQWQQPDPYGGMPAETPSEPVAMPPVGRGGASAAVPALTGAQKAQGGGGGLLDTTGKKVAVFGTLGLLVLVGGALVVKTALGGGKADAQKLFVEGKSAFAAGDYDKAKKLFSDAATKDPALTEAAKYAGQCDKEIFARGKIALAQKLAAGKKWDEELKALDSVDKEAVSYDEAMKLRKAAIPEAVKSYVDEAKAAMTDDADTARTKLEAAIELDPDNAEAQELLGKLKSGGGTEVAVAPSAPERPAKPGREPKTRPAPPPKPVKVTPAAPPPGKKKPTPDDDDDDDAPAAGGGGDLLSNKAAAGPYKAKDFLGAATALRTAAKTAKGPAAQKLNTQAAQAARLADTYQKAEADKTRNPAQSVQEYQAAISLDAALGKGMHGAYFKGQALKLAKDAARQAFSLQRFDTAYEMTKAAQRFGGDDGGMLAQLKSKAAELNNKAAAKVRSDPNGAKGIWRQVLRMVPPNDPEYLKATKGLQSSSGAKDEDED